MVGFSPIAVAVPVLTPFCKQVAVTPTSATGTCLRDWIVNTLFQQIDNPGSCNIVKNSLFLLTMVLQADP